MDYVASDNDVLGPLEIRLWHLLDVVSSGFHEGISLEFLVGSCDKGWSQVGKPVYHGDIRC